jgi:HlyD family secretion protein
MLSSPKFRWWLAVIGLAVVVGGVLGVRWWRGTPVSTEHAVRRDFVQTLVASGRVENPHRVDIGAQITGTVRRVPVREGQAVRAGDVLIELVDLELRSAELQADIAVAQAHARLRQLTEVQRPLAEQSQRQAQVNLDNARAIQGRNEDLFARQFIGEAALQESRRAADFAEAQWLSAQKQWDSTGASGSDYAMAQTAVAQAQASAQAAHARAAYATIRAPAAGLLIGRSVEAGDVVQPGKVLMTLSPQGDAQLVLSIDEKNLRLIALGQQALASADAYPQQKFPAEVAYINPGVNPQTGAVEVKLNVVRAPATLRQDMTVSVDIELARRDQALLLPLAVVHDIEGAAPWVLQSAQGIAVKVPVRIGLRSGGWVEVLQGLGEGAAVIAAPPGVAPGARVHPSP